MPEPLVHDHHTQALRDPPRISRVPGKFADRLKLPIIAAPMLHVSGPELVAAACQSGVIGSFPTANARSIDELDRWLSQIAAGNERFEAETGCKPAPVSPNLIIRQVRLAQDLECLVRHRVEMVITSVGSPASAVAPLHDMGCLVFADIGTLRHAERALEAGVDGLVLLSAGAGGQTGWLNPLAFTRAVRKMFDGPIVLAGGISDGVALFAAQVLGADLAYMGTKFIATRESRAEPNYRDMLVASSLDDVLLTAAFTGLQTNMLLPSIRDAGLDPAKLSERISIPEAADMWGGKAAGHAPKRWKDIWSAGHTVSGVSRIMSVAEMISETLDEYDAARRAAVNVIAMEAA